MNKTKILLYTLLLLITVFSVSSTNTISGLTTYIPSTAQEQPVNNVNTNLTNIIIINVTNNITNYVTSWNNITNNLTNYVTSYVNVTNDIVNNITNEVYYNITNNITINVSNNYYSGWLTIENNITNYVDNYVTNNITNNITTEIYPSYNISFYSNCSANFTVNIFNITNNYSYYYLYNDTSLWTALYYNISLVNSRIDILNESYYGELSDYDITLDTLTLTIADTYYNITSFGNTLYNNGWYQSGNYLICNKSGLYDLSYSMVFSNNVAGQNFIFAVFNNNVQIDKSLIGVKTSANELYTIEKSFLYRFNIGDSLNIRAMNEDTSGKVITFTTKDLHLAKVGD